MGVRMVCDEGSRCGRWSHHAQLFRKSHKQPECLGSQAPSQKGGSTPGSLSPHPKRAGQDLKVFLSARAPSHRLSLAWLHRSRAACCPKMRATSWHCPEWHDPHSSCPHRCPQSGCPKTFARLPSDNSDACMLQCRAGACARRMCFARLVPVHVPCRDTILLGCPYRAKCGRKRRWGCGSVGVPSYVELGETPARVNTFTQQPCQAPSQSPRGRRRW